MQGADGLLSKQVACFLAKQEEKTLAEQAAERRMIATTRVDFETMKA
jgi:alpha-D-ribose 1-methylphosphonate 5-triphosphate synthase subunit PhnG